MHFRFGLPASLWYALSLPIASLVSYAYEREARRILSAVRSSTLLVRLRFGAPLLFRLRTRLIREIDAIRTEYRKERYPGQG